MNSRMMLLKLGLDLIFIGQIRVEKELQEANPALKTIQVCRRLLEIIRVHQVISRHLEKELHYSLIKY